MASPRPDRFKVAPAFWQGLGAIGITPAAVLRHARLPATLAADARAQVTTAQYFSLWRSLQALSSDSGVGLRLVTGMEPGTLPPAFLAAYYARDLRDALTRVARFKALCSPEEMILEEDGDTFSITLAWPLASEEAPPVLIDAAFAAFVELGRRGTGRDIRPRRLELSGTGRDVARHAEYLGCPVVQGADRSVLVLNRSDLDVAMVSHNPEMLDVLDPHLAHQRQEHLSKVSITEQVKWVLKRLLAGQAPDVSAVAQELGLTARTLQRRITEEGGSFRQILADVRRELVRQYLADPALDMNEVAYLLGYDDTNSFYRAFRSLEGMTPARWRSLH